MKLLVACTAVYVVMLAAWICLAHPPARGRAFVPIDIRFCKDWRDDEPSLCERIPFRKEVAI